MKILVTGGLGYIGSHTIIELINSNHEVIIVDNLINSKINVLEKLNNITGRKLDFYKIDVTSEKDLENIFINHNIEGVIHFAGYKSVAESVSEPLNYYYNNLLSTITLSKLCIKYGVSRFVFSSSATVYGDQPSPLKESLKLEKTTNPYGETKAVSERILVDTATANIEFKVTILRYFNPVGAHPSGLIGEDPKGLPNNLMPFINKVAKGELEKLNIFGDDYNTIDGTGVRDYIHVVDIAKGHVSAIEKTKNRINIYNLGTGKGTSVLELVNTFKEVNKVNIPYQIVNRRPGDIAVCFADVDKVWQELEWKAEFEIEDMVRDSWNFALNNK